MMNDKDESNSNPREANAESLLKQPEGKAIGTFKPAPSFQPPETCPECAEGVPFNERGHHHWEGK